MSSRDNRGVLIVEPPSQVRFHGPFTRPVVTTVTLINPTDYKIIFKIKTTAPTAYGVRPNFGVVQPRNFTEVEIARQPFNFDQNEKINHKFMVQSLTVPTHVEDLNRVWENADPSQLHASKLRCVFEMPTGAHSPATFSPHAKKSPEESVHNLSNRSAASSKLSNLESQMPKTILKNTTQEDHTKTTTPTHRLDSQDNFTNQQLATLNTEMRQLHNENNVLRKENTILKDEIDQIRSLAVRREITVPHYPITDSNDPTRPVPFFYVLTSVSIAVVSIFIGKYIL